MSKVPKKIAGVKIPKVLRKNSLLKGMLGTAAGRQIAADALVAAAGAAAAALVAVKSGAAKEAGRSLAKTGASFSESAGDTGEIVKRAVKDAANAMTDVLSNAAQEALGKGKADHTRPARPH